MHVLVKAPRRSLVLAKAGKAPRSLDAMLEAGWEGRHSSAKGHKSGIAGDGGHKYSNAELHILAGATTDPRFATAPPAAQQYIRGLATKARTAIELRIRRRPAEGKRDMFTSEGKYIKPDPVKSKKKKTAAKKETGGTGFSWTDDEDADVAESEPSGSTQGTLADFFGGGGTQGAAPIDAATDKIRDDMAPDSSLGDFFDSGPSSGSADGGDNCASCGASKTSGHTFCGSCGEKHG